MITVVIVDDHPVVRAGMRKVLDAAGDVSVLAEGDTGARALELVETHHPDVLLLDIRLPDLTGSEVAQKLQDRGDPTAVLVLTAYKDPRTVFSLLQRGAAGYVLKDEALETLAEAVRAAAAGDTWLSPAVASQVVDRALGDAPGGSETSLPTPLTPRETEVLCLLGRGLDNSAIAEALTVTKRTVQNHVSSIYGKLHVSSRTQAALWAIRQGMVEIENPGGGGHDDS